MSCEYLTKLAVDATKEVTHLQIVLRRKNRRVSAQHATIKAQQRRIYALLNAFDAVQRSTSQEAAQQVAAAVLKYDERRRSD